MLQLHNKDHAKDAVRPAIEKVLKELQIEQLDLFLMHWPVTGNKGDTVEPPIQVSWVGSWEPNAEGEKSAK